MKKINSNSDKDRRCRFCYNYFLAEYNHRVYCSTKCQKKHYYEQHKEKIISQNYEWIKNNLEKHRMYARNAYKSRPRNPKVKQCPICSQSFSDLTFNACKKFCSLKCRNKSHAEYRKAILHDWRHQNYERYKAQWTRNNHKNKERFKVRRQKMIQKLGNCCSICGFGQKVHIHHKLPKSKGGSNNLDNLVLLCPNHHVMLHAGALDANLTKQLLVYDLEFKK